MNGLLIVLLTLTGVLGTVAVFVDDPVRQTIVVGILGLVLALVFFAVQAPDVALSELVVGGAALPLMILMALAEIRAQAAAAKQRREESEEQ